MALLDIGTTDWTQVGDAAWGGGGFDFDTLRVTYSGSVNKKNAFLGGLKQGKPSSLDGNMLLDSWNPSGGSAAIPRVDLLYIGCKGGKLPLPKISRSSTVGVVPAKTISAVTYTGIVYLIPSQTKSWITRTETPRPSSAGIIHLPSSALRFGINFLKYAYRDTISTEFFLSYCRVLEGYADFQSEEIIPGRYWQNRMTTTWTLI